MAECGVKKWSLILCVTQYTDVEYEILKIRFIHERDIFCFFAIFIKIRYNL